MKARKQSPVPNKRMDFEDKGVNANDSFRIQINTDTTDPDQKLRLLFATHTVQFVDKAKAPSEQQLRCHNWHKSKRLNNVTNLQVSSSSHRQIGDTRQIFSRLQQFSKTVPCRPALFFVHSHHLFKPHHTFFRPATHSHFQHPSSEIIPIHRTEPAFEQ